MTNVRVRLGSRSYEIRIGPNILPQLGKWLREIAPGDKVVIITNPVVESLHMESLKRELAREGFKPAVLIVPDGEDQKSLETAGRLYSELAGHRAERSTPLLALGGGVIGDLAGFVAATYMRGLPLVHVPTTLLAQVDSSIGGKVAVDHGRIKNSIGVFYQPALVVADTATLKTLPAGELSNGLAEVIKYAVIGDNTFFSYLENNIEKIMALDTDALEEITVKSAVIKARIVEKDEKDTGLRNMLNFGHTIGHAVESASDFGISHGQAVAIGMVAAARIASKLGTFSTNDLSRLKRLIARTGLPTKVPELDTGRLIEAMEHDKKISEGKIRFILPRSIGKVFISDNVGLPLVRQVLESSDEEA